MKSLISPRIAYVICTTDKSRGNSRARKCGRVEGLTSRNVVGRIGSKVETRVRLDCHPESILITATSQPLILSPARHRPASSREASPLELKSMASREDLADFVTERYRQEFCAAANAWTAGRKYRERTELTLVLVVHFFRFLRDLVPPSFALPPKLRDDQQSIKA